MDVFPLAQAAHVDEVLAQELLVLAVAEFVNTRCRRRPEIGVRARVSLREIGIRPQFPFPTRIRNPFPQLQIPAELTLLIIKLRMRLVGLGLHIHGAVAHVLHAQGRGNHQHLVQRVAAACFQNHAAHARVQWQARQFLTQGREFVGLVHCAQLGQQLVAVGNRPARWPLQKREVFHRAQAQRLHPQNHTRQRRAQDFRVGKAVAPVKVFLLVQANANAIGHPPATPGALVGRTLADGLYEQLLHLAAKAIALDARRTRVDHIADARHRERGLGHVGRQHHAPPGVAVKNAVLLGGAQARKQRQHLAAAHHRLVAQMAAQMVCGLADLALARQENQNIAAHPAAPQLVHAIGNRVVQVVFAAFLKRAVALLHREHAARNHDHRRGRQLAALGRGLQAGKVVGKPLRVNRGRGHDDFQIGSARQYLAQVTEQKVNVQAALVRLVNDDGVVGVQQRVGLRLGQQNAVGHQLHRRIAREPVLEPHLETHHLAQRRLQLLGNPLGHAAGRNPPGLRVADQLAARRGPAIGQRGGVIAQPAPHGQGNLGQLRGFARAGFATDDDDLVPRQRGHDLLALGGDWEVFWEFDVQARRHCLDYRPEHRFTVSHIYVKSWKWVLHSCLTHLGAWLCPTSPFL